MYLIVELILQVLHKYSYFVFCNPKFNNIKEDITILYYSIPIKIILTIVLRKIFTI